MTELQAWLVSAAATLAAFGVLYRTVVRPVAAAISEFARDLRTLATLVDEWPGHAAGLSFVQRELGRLEGSVETLKADVDRLWQAHRDHLASIGAPHATS